MSKNKDDYLSALKNKIVEMLLEDELIINEFLISKKNYEKYSTYKEDILKCELK